MPFKKEIYVGYKVHTMITLKGYITTFEIKPASTDNRKGLRDVVECQLVLVILGDKGYVGENLTKKCQIGKSVLWHSNIQTAKLTWSKPVHQLIFNLPKRVETVFSPVK